ncbi:MAG: NAD(P)-binding domain-containing protein [Candidatus Acidiferrales bacterium]
MPRSNGKLTCVLVARRPMGSDTMPNVMRGTQAREGVLRASAKNEKIQRSDFRPAMLETAIIGAGPYGLSVAAHCRWAGVPFRIFGKPMDSWRSHMPKGMLLKSDGFASNVSDPDGNFTLQKYCAEQGIEYSDMGSAVRLETFGDYGLAFQERNVPELEDRMVVGLERTPEGFAIRLDNGEALTARRVVLAVGITHFSYVPAELKQLPPEFLSHSYDQCDLERFRAKSVVVLGAGSSALDLAGLLHQSGANVQLVARRTALQFHTRQGGPSGRRSLWDRIRHPKSGLGPGLKTRFCANSPMAFYHMPESYRLKTVRTLLGPAGGWFAKEMVIGRVPVQLGCTPVGAEVVNGKVNLRLREESGSERTIQADHVIAATGYKVDMASLPFLSAEIRSKIKIVGGMPALSTAFECSVPGLYFVGLAAANSFGPLMRFAYGSKFAATRLSKVLAKSVAKERANADAARPVAATK